VTGLLLLSGLLSLLGTSVAYAGTTTVEITDVYNALTASDEWFQLYNATDKTIGLNGYQVCTSTTCVAVPTGTIDPFSLKKIFAKNITTWPKTGLDGAADMLGLLGADGKPVDSVNWGTPNPAWKNYTTFKDMLFNPGVTPRDPKSNQSFFRAQISNDTDRASDWLSTVPTDTGGTTPAATATSAPSSGGTATPTKTPTSAPVQATTNPKTGGEFPLFLTVVLIVAVLGVRYFRLRRSSPVR